MNVVVTEKSRRLQQLTLKYSLPLLVDHKPSSPHSARQRTYADIDSVNYATKTLGTLMLKEIREMRFLALNFVKNGNVRCDIFVTCNLSCFLIYLFFFSFLMFCLTAAMFMVNKVLCV